MTAYDPQDQMMKVKSTQKKVKADFSGNALDLTKWDLIQTGAGQTITVSAGELTIASGTTTNAETIIRLKEVFTIPFKTLFGFSVSQKIANQEFYMEVISVDPNTGQPDGKESAAWRIAGNDNTTTTNAVYTVGTSGMAVLASGNSTINSMTSYSMVEIETFADECWFHARNMDNVAGRTASYVRHQSIPSPNAYYKVQLRAKNLGTTPASNTNFKFQFVNVVDYAELTAEITAGRGNMAIGQAIGVQVLNTPSTSLFGISQMQGSVGHDGPSANNPFRIAGKAVNVMPTAVSATGDIHDGIMTMHGALIQKPYAIPEADWYFAAPAAITVNTDQVVKAAGAAGIRNYVTGVQLQNTGTTATEVVLKDGATVIWRGYLPASMPGIADVNFATPLRGTTATAINFACITAAANVYANVQGYQAP